MLQRCVFFVLLLGVQTAWGSDHLRELQGVAIREGSSTVAYWGTDPEKYTEWGSHSNRLIPVYTFGTKGAGKGIDLRDYIDENSPYRNEDAVRRLYGYLPESTVWPDATYADQTNIHDIQLAALAAGKKHVILVVFDGMDWETTRAAAAYYSRKAPYVSGWGHGLHFLDYEAGGNRQFGAMVTSPHNAGTRMNVDTQTVLNPGGQVRGGYDMQRGGAHPWSTAADMGYPIGKPAEGGAVHAYTDSSSSATSMTTGIKTYNDAINVDPGGAQVATVAHEAQQKGMAVGAVTSVPICHATPAASYAHNVQRDDYQDLARDMLGLRSISHPEQPLPGMDVVIGTGWGMEADADREQGENYVAGNRCLTAADMHAIDARNGGRYVIAQRQAGVKGGDHLRAAAEEAARDGKRLLGFFGTDEGHLPYRTADGDYHPTVGRKDRAESYSREDVDENPTLAQMTAAALTVLEKNPRGFWLMVESGDVDWANHDNNLDNSIGAVKSGDDAVRVITEWVDRHSNWNESLLIVTADHGHYLHVLEPGALIPPTRGK